MRCVGTRRYQPYPCYYIRWLIINRTKRTSPITDILLILMIIYRPRAIIHWCTHLPKLYQWCLFGLLWLHVRKILIPTSDIDTVEIVEFAIKKRASMAKLRGEKTTVLHKRENRLKVSCSWARFDAPRSIFFEMVKFRAFKRVLFLWCCCSRELLVILVMVMVCVIRGRGLVWDAWKVCLVVVRKKSSWDVPVTSVSRLAVGRKGVAYSVWSQGLDVLLLMLKEHLLRPKRLALTLIAS
jgi:hypothetical protein